MDLEALKAPFSPLVISWRVGATNSEKTKGIALAYLNARDVMERLDEVCGPMGWQAEYPFEGCCRIGIANWFHRIDSPPQVEWVWKTNGAGKSDIEAEKGQYSDAFKRAAVLWGIGRYLYDLPNTWYPIESRGRSYGFTKEAEKQMTQFLHDWQYNRTWEHPNDRKKFLEAIDNAWAEKDSDGLKKIWADMTNEQKQDIWSVLKEFSAKRAAIKVMLGGH
jgi:hypothetical protein